MNEVTAQSLHSLSVRAASLSSKSSADKVDKEGKSLPPLAASQPKLGAAISETKAAQPIANTVESTPAQRESRQQVDAAVAEMNQQPQVAQRDIQFAVDDSSGRTVVTVLDRHTQEVVRQIPDEVFLRMAQKLKEEVAAGIEEPLHLINAQA